MRMKKMKMKRLTAVILTVAMLFTLNSGSVSVRAANTETAEAADAETTQAEPEETGGLPVEEIGGSQFFALETEDTCPLKVASVANGSFQKMEWNEETKTLTIVSSIGVLVGNKDSSKPAQARLDISAPTVVFSGLNLDGSQFTDSLVKLQSNQDLILSGENILSQQETALDNGVLFLAAGANVKVSGSDDASLTVKAQPGKKAIFGGGGRNATSITMNSGRVSVPSGYVDPHTLIMNNGTLEIEEQISYDYKFEVYGGTLKAGKVYTRIESVSGVANSGINVTGGTVKIGTLQDVTYGGHFRTWHSIRGGNVAIGTVETSNRTEGYCQLVGTLDNYSNCEAPFIVVPDRDGSGTVEIPRNETLNGTLSIPPGCELIIPEGVTLTVPSGETVNNNGIVRVLGQLQLDGTWNGNPAIAVGKGAWYQVKGGQEGTDYVFRADGLHILTNTALTVSPLPGSSRGDEPRIWVDTEISSLTLENTTAVSDDSFITIAGGKKVSLTLKDCNLSSGKGAAIKVGDNASLTLNAEDANALAAGAGHAAVEVNEKSSVVIQGSGSLAATGGSNAAAVGACNGRYQGSIIIQDNVNVSALGGGKAAGIGSGYIDGEEVESLNAVGFPGKEIQIGGNARVNADSESGVGIGGGLRSRDIRFPMDGLNLLEGSKPEGALMKVKITGNAQVTATGSDNIPVIGSISTSEDVPAIGGGSITPVNLTVEQNAAVSLKGSAGLGTEMRQQQGEWANHVFNWVGSHIVLSGNARLISEGRVFAYQSSFVYNNNEGVGKTGNFGVFSVTVEDSAVLSCPDGLTSLKERIDKDSSDSKKGYVHSWNELFHFTGGILLDSSDHQIFFLGNNATFGTGSDTDFELTGALEFPKDYKELTFPDNFTMTVKPGASLDINQSVNLGSGKLKVDGTVTVGGVLRWNGSTPQNLIVNTGGTLQKVNSGQIIPTSGVDFSQTSSVPVITQAQVQGVTMPYGIKTYGTYSFDGAAANVQLMVKNGSINQSDYSAVWKVNESTELYNKLKAGTLDAGRYTLQLTLSLNKNWNGSFDSSLNGLHDGASCTRSDDGKMLTMKWSFTISPKTLPEEGFSLKQTNFQYAGSPIKPELTVPDGLTRDKDYTVTYHYNNGAGTGLVVVAGAGNYRGSVQLKFTIAGGFTLKFMDYLMNNYSYKYTSVPKKLSASDLRLVAEGTGTQSVVDADDLNLQHYRVEGEGDSEQLEPVDSMLMPGKYRVKASLKSDAGMTAECNIEIEKLDWIITGAGPTDYDGTALRGAFHKLYDGKPLGTPPAIDDLLSFPGFSIEGEDLNNLKDRIGIAWSSPDSVYVSKYYSLKLELPETELMNEKSTSLYAVGRIDPAKLEVVSVTMENRTTGKSATLDPAEGLDFGQMGTYQDEVWATVTFRREDGAELNLSESEQAKIWFYRPVNKQGYVVSKSITGNSVTFQLKNDLTYPEYKYPQDIQFRFDISSKDSAYELAGPGVNEDGEVWGSCLFEKKPFCTVTVTPSEQVKVGTELTANWNNPYGEYPDKCQWYRIRNGVKDSATLIIEHEVDNMFQDTYTVTADDVGCDIVVVVTCYIDTYYKEATSDPVTVDKYENTNSAPTDGKVDDEKDTFTFTPASGKSITDYEYSTDNGETWTNVTVNPIQVGALRIPAGYFQVREKATDTVQPGAPLVSTKDFTAALNGNVTISGDVIYGETLQAQVTGAQPDAQLSYKWKVGDTVVADVSGDSYTLKGKDIGKTVTVTVAEETGVGGITYSGTLTSSAAKAVAKRPVTVDISDLEKSYGEKDPAELVWEIAEGSLVEGDELSISGTRTPGEDVGQYPITMVPTEEKQNKYYEIKSKNNPMLIISPANVNVEISVTPDEQIDGSSVTVTASAEIVGNNLMESGWEQPGIPTVSVSGIGSLSDTVTMTKQADGSWQGIYTIPAETATGRLKFTAEIADKNYAATSKEAFVNVTEADYTLVPNRTALDFGKETYEYKKPEAKELSVANKGNSLSRITDIQLTGTNADAFELARIPAGQNPVDIPIGNTVKICSVQPKTGLNVGTYRAQLTITYTGGGTASVDVSFVVEKKKREVPDNAWTVDWTAETVAYDETVYEINDAQDGTGKALATGADLGAYEGNSVYIRAMAQDENNYIPSAWKEIVVPERPAAPGEPTVTERTTDKISMKKQEGQEYRLREKDGTWGEWQDEPVFDGLTPGTEYELETRKKVVDGTSFVGEPTSVPVTTSTGGTAEPGTPTPAPAPGGTAGPETPTPAPGEPTEPETTPTPAPAPGGTAGSETPAPTPGTALPAPGEPMEPETTPTPAPAPGMPSKEEQTKNELTLNAKMKVSQSGRKIKVSWEKISGADGYDVYFQYCGKKYTKKSIIAVKSGTTKVTVKKVNGKLLNRKKSYRIYVLAYKLADGKKITLGKTITAHIVGKMNTEYTNVKAVRVKKSSYRLKKGRTAQIKASTVLESPGKKQLSDAHVKQFRYAATNNKVATVSKNGKIKAVGKGICTIYVYARNGYAKKIKVTVK